MYETPEHTTVDREVSCFHMIINTCNISQGYLILVLLNIVYCFTLLKRVSWCRNIYNVTVIDNIDQQCSSMFVLCYVHINLSAFEWSNARLFRYHIDTRTLSFLFFFHKKNWPVLMCSEKNKMICFNNDIRRVTLN